MHANGGMIKSTGRRKIIKLFSHCMHYKHFAVRNSIQSSRCNQLICRRSNSFVLCVCAGSRVAYKATGGYGNSNWVFDGQKVNRTYKISLYKSTYSRLSILSQLWNFSLQYFIFTIVWMPLIAKEKKTVITRAVNASTSFSLLKWFIIKEDN